MKRALLLTIRFYQRFFSPLLLPACRYVPTCSQYAHQAVELHGPAKGALLAAWRLLRCHPFSRGGYNPVPQDATHAHVAHHRVAEFCAAEVRIETAGVEMTGVAHAPSRVLVEAPGSCSVALAPSRVQSSSEALLTQASHAYAQETSHSHVSHAHVSHTVVSHTHPVGMQ